jgi:hypothetical protein
MQPPVADVSGRALAKYAFVRQLNLQPGEVAALYASAQWDGSTPSINYAPAQQLALFEGAPLPSLLPPTDTFRATPAADLLAFGKALTAYRVEQLNQLTTPTNYTMATQPSVTQTAVAGDSMDPQALAANLVADLVAFGKSLSGQAMQLTMPSGSALTTQPSATATTVESLPSATQTAGAGQLVDPQALALHLVNAAQVATSMFGFYISTTPIGLVNLERLEMWPAGIERGELIATIPLAPLERTAVVQKEWSVTTKEFTSIVTDSLENYSETGVTENTELAQSTTSQIQHSNQSNVNATVSGGVNFATVVHADAQVTTSSAFQDATSNSATASTKHAIATTKKASSRVKQEHKVTISTSTVTGTSETTTRTLQNPSQTNPMRIDYYSLMRKWHVGLYQYGARLTYDIIIPEPGGTLREAYALLSSLQELAAAPFTFNLSYTDITKDIVDNNGKPAKFGTPKYLWLAQQYGAQVELAPDTKVLWLGGHVSGLTGQSDTWSLPFTVDPGYWVFDVEMWAQVSSNTSGNMTILGYPPEFTPAQGTEGLTPSDPMPNTSPWPWPNIGTLQSYKNLGDNDFMFKEAGNVSITAHFNFINDAWLGFKVTTTPDASTHLKWQQDVWSALYNAAQTTYYATQQSLQAQVQVIQDKLDNVDTLTLRREEHDEIMKQTLRWLLGPGFEFMPDDVVKLFKLNASLVFGPSELGQQLKTIALAWGISFPGNMLFPGTTAQASTAFWTTVGLYEDQVRLINEAIDWDNMLYFLYSYFWDVPTAWENIRQIQHPDPTRQAFLRAGAARVVLTVRKGWEIDWINAVEGGQFTNWTSSPEKGPYLSIAQEIQDYDNTNYPGIPPANPGIAPDDGSYAATECTQLLDPAKLPATDIPIPVTSSDGFKVGYWAIIDTWDAAGYENSGNQTQPQQETQLITDVPDSTHITVQALKNKHKGSPRNPIPIIQGGEKGQLIAEWYEYTPSSGTDIAVTIPAAETTID